METGMMKGVEGKDGLNLVLNIKYKSQVNEHRKKIFSFIIFHHFFALFSSSVLFVMMLRLVWPMASVDATNFNRTDQ